MNGAPVDEHRYALLDGRTIDIEQVAAAGTATRIAALRAASRRGDLVCVVCGQGLSAKLGEHVRWHFAHRPDCEYIGHEPESTHHKRGKDALLAWARVQYPGAESRLEWRLPQIRQIADVLIAPLGRRPLALEIQYADLSPASWRARHQGYLSIGVDDLWLLGHSRMKLRNAGREANLDTLASAFAAAHHPIIYLNGRSGYVTVIQIPASARFAAARGERLGWTPVASEKVPLSRLRMQGPVPVIGPA